MCECGKSLQQKLTFLPKKASAMRHSKQKGATHLTMSQPHTLNQLQLECFCKITVKCRYCGIKAQTFFGNSVFLVVYLLNYVGDTGCEIRDSRCKTREMRIAALESCILHLAST